MGINAESREEERLEDKQCIELHIQSQEAEVENLKVGERVVKCVDSNGVWSQTGSPLFVY